MNPNDDSIGESLSRSDGVIIQKKIPKNLKWN